MSNHTFTYRLFVSAECEDRRIAAICTLTAEEFNSDNLMDTLKNDILVSKGAKVTYFISISLLQTLVS